MKYYIRRKSYFYSQKPVFSWITETGFFPFNLLKFESRKEALKHIKKLDEETYVLSSGEYSKPDYTAISENNLPDYIKVIS
jgi:hypothetical protein